MLKFPNEFCADKKANDIVKEFYNNRLIDMMDVHMLMYAPGGYEAIRENDEEFGEYLNMFFPENYPAEKRAGKFLGLFALLKAKDEFVPELVMEYVLDAILAAQVDVCQDCGSSTIERVPEREYVLEKLGEEDWEVDETAEERLTRYEDLENYLDYVFWDVDFAMLDEYTMEEIESSDMNKELGITDGRRENVFELPKEWIK